MKKPKQPRLWVWVVLKRQSEGVWLIDALCHWRVGAAMIASTFPSRRDVRIVRVPVPVGKPRRAS